MPSSAKNNSNPFFEVERENRKKKTYLLFQLEDKKRILCMSSFKAKPCLRFDFRENFPNVVIILKIKESSIKEIVFTNTDGEKRECGKARLRTKISPPMGEASYVGVIIFDVISNPFFFLAFLVPCKDFSCKVDLKYCMV